MVFSSHMTIFTNGMLSSAIKKSLWYVIIEESAVLAFALIVYVKYISYLCGIYLIYEKTVNLFKWQKKYTCSKLKRFK